MEDQSPWFRLEPDEESKALAGGQIIGILLCRGFMSTIPQELFESTRLDGASEFQMYRHIVVPLSVPILIAIGIINFHGIYNDFIWPLMILQDQNLKTFAVAIFELSTVYRFSYAFRYSSELPRRGCEIHRSRPGRNLAYVVYWTIHKPISHISQPPISLFSQYLRPIFLLSSWAFPPASLPSGVAFIGFVWVPIQFPQSRPTLAEVPKPQPSHSAKQTTQFLTVK